MSHFSRREYEKLADIFHAMATALPLPKRQHFGAFIIEFADRLSSIENNFHKEEFLHNILCNHDLIATHPFARPQTRPQSKPHHNLSDCPFTVNL